VKVTLCTTEGKQRVLTVAELLPGVFTASHMDKV
jgi:cytidine deaminase